MEEGHLENPGVDERIMLQWILKVGWREGGGSTDCFNLYQDRNKWRGNE